MKSVVGVILLILLSVECLYALNVDNLQANSRVVDIAFSHNGKLMASGSDDGERNIQIWDIENNSLVSVLDAGNFRGLISLSFSPNDKILVSGSKMKRQATTTWDIETGKLLRVFGNKDSKKVPANAKVEFLDNSHFVEAISDGQITIKDPLRIYDINSGKYRAINLPRGTSSVENMILSHNKSILAIDIRTYNELKNKIYLYDVKTRKLIKSLPNDLKYLRGMAFSPNSKLIATIANEKYKGSHLNIWNIKTGKIIKTLVHGEKHGTFRSIDWSNDGKYIVAGTEYSIYVWDVSSGKIVRKIRNSKSNIVKFNNNDLRLAVVSGTGPYGCNGKTIMLYDTSPIMLSINDLTEKIYNKKLSTAPALSLPPKPQKNYIKEKTLVKGEFETTKAFLIRQEEAKDKIKQENIKIDKAYILDIKKWKSKIYELEKEHESKVIEFESSKSKMYYDSIQEAVKLKYGVPTIEYANYNADKEVFNISVNLERGGYKQKFEIPVSLKYAKKFKGILTDKKFKPIVEFELINGKINATGIEQIKDPELLVRQKNELDKARYSKSKLEGFIKKYQNSDFVIEAKQIIKKIELQEIQTEKESKARKAKEEKQRKIREAHYAKKYVGDKVCKDGTTAIILSITITAYVERVNGNSIQLRISDTEGTSPHMNGVTLYRDTLIWDDYYNWYKCN